MTSFPLRVFRVPTYSPNTTFWSFSPQSTQIRGLLTFFSLVLGRGEVIPMSSRVGVLTMSRGGANGSTRGGVRGAGSIASASSLVEDFGDRPVSPSPPPCSPVGSGRMVKRLQKGIRTADERVLDPLSGENNSIRGLKHNTHWRFFVFFLQVLQI